MTGPVLTSLRNPRVVEVAKLHDARTRRAAGLTLVEGPHQLADVIAFGASIRDVFVLDGDATGLAVANESGGPATVVGHGVMRRLGGTEHPRGPVAVVETPTADPILAVDSVVMWGLQDPGNVGAIIRSATAFGFSIVAAPGTSDVWAPKAIRAAAAAQFGARISLPPAMSLDTLERAGLRPVAAVAVGGNDSATWRPPRPVALLIGNEVAGLPPDVVDAAPNSVSLSLQGGVESLNAAVAASLLMYALRTG